MTDEFDDAPGDAAQDTLAQEGVSNETAGFSEVHDNAFGGEDFSQNALAAMDQPIGAGIGFPDGPMDSAGQSSMSLGTVDLLDVPLDVSVELGRSRMPIQQVVALTSGSVIELDKVAGEPLDVLLNGRLVARGEAVVVGERFGVRITSIVSPRERLARLN
ncbi:MAG: flagellar motor switch protein FliN [Deltaproteobacteria bacterium]|nr:flagellar motor switch protein FliN [Deltaproteobacteria bacterium]